MCLRIFKIFMVLGVFLEVLFYIVVCVKDCLILLNFYSRIRDYEYCVCFFAFMLIY